MMRRLARLWPHGSALHRLSARSILAGVLQGILLMVLVPLLQSLLDTPAHLGDAARWLSVVAVLGAAYLATQWWAKSSGYRTANRIMRDLQHGVGEHLERVPLGWFTGNQAGRLARTVSQSTTTAAGIISHVWPELVHALVTPATIALCVFLVDWRMGVAFLVTVPLAALVMRWSGPVVRETQAVMDRASAEGAGRAIEFAQAQPVFRATGRALEGFAPMERALDEQRRAFRTALTRHTAPQFAYLAVIQAGFTVVLLTGVWLVLGGRLGVAETVALLVLAARFIEPLAQVATMFGTVRVADVALERVAEVMAVPPLPEPETPRPPALDDARIPAVQLDEVHFGYDASPVLAGLCLTVPQGTTTALVGPSGAGKTTVLRLVARFWDVRQGAVRGGGVDVRELATPTLMNALSIVFQDTYLFSGTIEDNLRIAAPDAAPDTHLRAAASSARLDAVVDRLPAGWDTQVGEGGLALSGGERQRVAVARALLKDAPIVLLDEATAALDPENEAAVTDCMQTLVARGRTVIVVAHRLSTVYRADQIAVIDGGRVSELGSHSDLLDAGGRYTRFWAERSQASGWQVAPRAAR
jgi:ATP-binding cassette, subfamily B, bacterial IrtB/YbtQ